MKKQTIYMLLGILLFVSPAASQEKEPSDMYAVSDTLEDFGMFTHDNLLELSLRFNVTEYTREKPREEYLDAMLTDRTNLTQRNMDPYLMTRMSVFNYMIGNTDWSVPNQHNCKILISTMPDRASTGIIVPYDFDYSGLINATYAVPHESLPIETVRERLFQGLCRSDEEFLSILGEFAAKKEAFYDVINNFPYLDEKEKKSMISYLDQFFDGINKRNSILYDIKQNCKDL